LSTSSTKELFPNVQKDQQSLEKLPLGKLEMAGNKLQNNNITDQGITNSNNVKKVAIVTPEPRFLKEQDCNENPKSTEPESIYKLLKRSNPKLNIEKCMKIDSTISQKSFTTLCNDLSRGVSPLLCRIECLECQKVWNLNRKNAKEVHSHLFDHKLLRNSSFFERNTFVFTSKNRVFPTSSSICFVPSFRCKNCKYFCSNFYNQDFVQHYRKCFKPVHLNQDQILQEIKICQNFT